MIFIMGVDITYLECIGFQNFDQGGTNSVMTYVMVVSAKTRRSEWFK